MTMRASTYNQRIRASYEVPTYRLPQVIRAELPRQARSCFVQEPESLHGDLYRTRAATHPADLPTARVIYLDTQEYTSLLLLLDEAKSGYAHSGISRGQLRAAPAYFFPYDLQALCSNASVLFSDCVQTLYDICWFRVSDLYDEVEDLRMVYVAFLPGRLDGRQTGPIFTTWIPQDRIAEALLWEPALEGLDSLEIQRLVNQQVIENGAKAPAPLPLEKSMVAFTHAECDEQFQVVPLKDPIFLRKEDMEGIDEEHQEDVIERACQVVNQQRQTLCDELANRQEVLPLCRTSAQRHVLVQAQCATLSKIERLGILGGWLEETLIWLSSAEEGVREERLIALSPIYETSLEPVKTKSGHIRHHKGQPVLRSLNQQTGYSLVVGIPIQLILEMIPKRRQKAYLQRLFSLPVLERQPVQAIA